MRTLFHLPLDPFSRKIRIVLAEKKIEVRLVVEQVWRKRPDFLGINPAGEVPVLLEPDGAAIAASQPIAEYLEDIEPSTPLIPGSAVQRAEVRRLAMWFDRKCYDEVTRNLVGEKLKRHLAGEGEPESARIRTGYRNVDLHLSYINLLAERRKWLGGSDFSLADISAAAQISCLDYLGDVPWDDYLEAKEWYARVKSRPSFHPLLEDVVAGQRPVGHYADLDF